MKVCKRDSPSARREVAAYKHLDALTTTTHAGSLLVCRLLDDFEIAGSGGEHLCLVHTPLAMDIESYQNLLPGKQLSEDLLKSVLKHLFLTLDFMHSEGRLIHTGRSRRPCIDGYSESPITDLLEQTSKRGTYTLPLRTVVFSKPSSQTRLRIPAPERSTEIESSMKRGDSGGRRDLVAQRFATLARPVSARLCRYTYAALCTESLRSTNGLHATVCSARTNA